MSGFLAPFCFETPSDPLCESEYPGCLLDLAVRHVDFNGTGGMAALRTSLLAIIGAKNGDRVFNEKIYFLESLPTEGCAGGCTDLTKPGWYGSRGTPGTRTTRLTGP